MSREEILRALHRASSPTAVLPSNDGAWTTYVDRTEQFAAALSAAGGRCVEVERSSLQAAIETVAASVRARRIVSLTADPPVEIGEQARPHDYDGVDLAVCPGAFGVAENGAVWVPGSAVPEQAILLLTQHLVLALDRHQIVHNMHEAYERLSFAQRSFGTFIAGPSKTADIEQSLVIGAHGPLSLTVLLVISG
jgi:L-lactate dehydrogenase complex protein LldG